MIARSHFRRSVRGAIRWCRTLSPVVFFAAFAGCTPPPVNDRALFCEALSDGVMAGGRTIAVLRIATHSETGDVPMAQTDVVLTAVGSRVGEPAGRIGVCGGDCVSATNSAPFVAEVKVRSDDQGVVVYTVEAGAAAQGSILVAVSNQTCVQPVSATAP